MNTKWKVALCAVMVAALLGGCATCERHPVVCTVGVAVLSAAAGAAIEHHRDRSSAGRLERDPHHGPVPFCHVYNPDGTCAP
jgi:hypothetical protein